MKRTSLADLAPRKAGGQTAPPAPVEATPSEGERSGTEGEDVRRAGAVPAPSPRAKSPPPYKSVLSKVDDATHRQMKRLAIDEGVPVGDLQIEALNLLFRSRGLPEIAVRVTPDESGRRER